MNTLTQEHAQSVRRTLERRAAQLRLELAEHGEIHDRTDAGPGVADTKDLASSRAVDEVGAAEVERDRDELRQIEAAFQRLAQSHYGQCTGCGNAIEAARLAAQPAATRCLTCQQQRERAQHP
ncbi:MAG: TraR/DksA C4-type zinc finger protein [Burkholderiales bacterium]